MLPCELVSMYISAVDMIRDTPCFTGFGDGVADPVPDEGTAREKEVRESAGEKVAAAATTASGNGVLQNSLLPQNSLAIANIQLASAFRGSFLLPATVALSSANRKNKEETKHPVNLTMLKYAVEPFTRLVYGSNMIESAGNSLDITRNLCTPVFQGQSFLVNADIDEAAEDYAEHVHHLRSNNRPSGHSEVVQSRREIIQHAEALLYTFLQIVKCGRPWSENLILNAHRLLHAGLDDQVDPGAYRTHEVAVKYEKPGQKRQKAHMCMRASAVPEYMEDMVEHLNQDTADPYGIRDPYALAARYHHQFVNIHPFGDGNGRMSRIILNALLLKHARPPSVSVFGLTEEERDTYIAIATRASQVFYAEDTEVLFDDHTGHLELTEFIRDRSVVVDGQ